MLRFWARISLTLAKAGHDKGLKQSRGCHSEALPEARFTMVLASGDQTACIAFIGNKRNLKAFVIGSGQNGVPSILQR